MQTTDRLVQDSLPSPLAEITQMTVTVQAQGWMEQLVKRGLFLVDAKGRAALDPQVHLLVDALHTVLAGGQVDVRVLRTGGQSVKADLDGKFQMACESTTRLQGTTVEPLAP